MDPLADKVMVTTVALALGQQGIVPTALVVRKMLREIGGEMGRERSGGWARERGAEKEREGQRERERMREREAVTEGREVEKSFNGVTAVNASRCCPAFALTRHSWWGATRFSSRE